MNKLLKLFQLQAPSYDYVRQGQIIDWFWKEVKSLGVKFEQDKYGNAYFTKGAGPYPTFVAHVDQVHDYYPNFTLSVKKDILMAYDSKSRKQLGVGGDDKSGIYVCLHFLTKLDNCKVALFLDEEVGCLGSAQCNLEFFSDSQFVGQADRRHSTADFINRTNGENCTSKEFDAAIKPIINKYNYDFNTGSVTDVGELKSNGLGVCCFNISAGYYNAHTFKEIVNIKELKTTISLLEEIVLLNKVWPHEKEASYYGYSGGWGRINSWDDEWQYRNSWDTTTKSDSCSNCGSTVERDLDFTYCYHCHQQTYKDEVICRGDTNPQYEFDLLT